MAKDNDEGPIDLDQMQVLTDAIAGTEKEIYRSAVGEPEADLDETGDQSLEQMGDGLEGEHEPAEEDEAEGDEADPEQVEAKDGDKPPRTEDGKFKEKPEGQSDDKHPVPRGVLQEERGKRQTAEQQLAAEREQRANDRKEFDARMAALEARVVAPKTEAVADPVKDERPDMFLDPVGARAYDDRKAAERETILRTEFSLKFAAVKHGETYTKAYAEFQKLNPRDPQQLQIGQSVARASDPGEALVNWYRQQETLKRVGADPDAYEKRVQAETRETLMKDPEFRKQIIADLQVEARGGANGAPRSVVKLPPSLNGASGSNSARNVDPELNDGSDKAVFASAFRD